MADGVPPDGDTNTTPDRVGNWSFLEKQVTYFAGGFAIIVAALIFLFTEIFDLQDDIHQESKEIRELVSANKTHIDVLGERINGLDGKIDILLELGGYPRPAETTSLEVTSSGGKRGN